MRSARWSVRSLGLPLPCSRLHAQRLLQLPGLWFGPRSRLSACSSLSPRLPARRDRSLALVEGPCANSVGLMSVPRTRYSTIESSHAAHHAPSRKNNYRNRKSATPSSCLHLCPTLLSSPPIRQTSTHPLDPCWPTQSHTLPLLWTILLFAPIVPFRALPFGLAAFFDFDTSYPFYPFYAPNSPSGPSHQIGSTLT